MATSSLLYVIGCLVLFHSGYSSYEVHQLLKSNREQFTSLPPDIIVETLVGIIIVLAASVRSIQNAPYLTIKNEKLQPESKYFSAIEMKEVTKHLEKVGINEYEELISRVDFIDIQEKRRKYSEWVNSK